VTENKPIKIKTVVNEAVPENTAFLVPPREYLPEKRRMETVEEWGKRCVKIAGLEREK
jgi:hypothetical protein